MRSYFQKYRPFFIFLFKFFVVYVVLTVIYQQYLNSFDAVTYEPDGFTRSVASQTEMLLNFFNYSVALKLHASQPSVMLFLENKYLARVVEGCNAISVMILFVAFVVAFKGTLKHTLLFIIFGCVIVHVLNVGRIALLSMALLHYPQYGEFLHGVIFPLFIYGVVFGLWIIWVNKFSVYAKKIS
ncbi:MAG TPA: exosortase family protein XrtF [Flavobacterium sp.]